MFIQFNSGRTLQLLQGYDNYQADTQQITGYDGLGIRYVVPLHLVEYYYFEETK